MTMAFLWEEVERSAKEVQEVFFNENLEKEKIRSFSQIRKGDHLVCKTSFSESHNHHCLCIDHNEEGNPIVIHYFGTSSGALRRLLPFSGSSSKNLGMVGVVQRTQLPNDDFWKDEADVERQDVQRIVWPSDMRRYSVNETIERAVSRERESYYDMVKNNCEHFVMWCMCGINTSLQVKEIFFAVQEILLALKHGLLQMLKTEAPRFILEWICSLVDDAAIAAGKLVSKGTKLPVGLSAGTGALVEIFIAGYEIHQANKKWDEGVLIKSREAFVHEVTKIVTAGVSRFGLGLGGAVLGQMLIPVPILGALVGAFVGAGLGNILGNLLGPGIGKEILWIEEKVSNLFG